MSGASARGGRIYVERLVDIEVDGFQEILASGGSQGIQTYFGRVSIMHKWCIERVERERRRASAWLRVCLWRVVDACPRERAQTE